MRTLATQQVDAVNETADIRREAFDRHVTEHADGAYRHALWLVRDPATAEELVQEAFTRAWQSRQTPLDRQEFRPWIHRIVGNLCRSHLRRQRIWQGLRLWSPGPEDPLAEFERRNGDPDLVVAIRRLRPRDRTAVYLFYYEDRPASEVAVALGISEGATRVLLHRALQRLRELLGDPNAQKEIAG